MERCLKGRALPTAVLAVLTAAALMLAGRSGPADVPAPEDLAALGSEAAEAALLGHMRKEVLRAWGEPDGTLSGFFGDVYELKGGAHIIVYYDTEPMSRGTADGYTVPVEQVKISAPD